MTEPEKTAADFFAGIGLVGAGLRRGGWRVKYALDHDEDKRKMYEAHFGEGHYHVKDVGNVAAEEVPDVSLIHASFPCTDTSLAGGRGGIDAGGESASFWKFARVLGELDERRPPLVMLENVEGLLTSNDNQDIKAVLEALCDLGYAVDLMLIDASHFVPQSRVRLFIVGAMKDDQQDAFKQEMILKQSDIRPAKIRHVMRQNPHLNWHIRELPSFPDRQATVADIVDETAGWWKRERTEYLFDQMFERHKKKVRRMMAKDEWSYGTVFRRTRKREGKRQSTAELRTDGIAGCLRCPKGGSARQILFRAGCGRYDARLLNGRECARLMGVPDYEIREDLRLNQVLWGFGDAVCASVTEWLAEHYLNPTLKEMTMEPTHS